MLVLKKEGITITSFPSNAIRMNYLILKDVGLYQGTRSAFHKMPTESRRAVLINRDKRETSTKCIYPVCITPICFHVSPLVFPSPACKLDHLIFDITSLPFFLVEVVGLKQTSSVLLRLRITRRVTFRKLFKRDHNRDRDIVFNILQSRLVVSRVSNVCVSGKRQNCRK